MPLTDTIYLTILVAAGGLMVALGRVGWVRRRVPGATSFVGLCLAVAVWCWGAALEYLVVDTPGRLLGARIQYLGIPFVPPLALVTALGFSHVRFTWPRPVWCLFWIIPVLTCLLAWTNESHHLIWLRIEPSAASPGAPLRYHYGIWFWISAAYSYLAILAAAVCCAWAVRAYPDPYRRQAAVLGFGAVVPIGANLLYLTNSYPFPSQDPTPLAFAVTSTAWAWGMTRMRLFDLGPIAREFLIERMTDGVLVLDPLGRVVDANPAASRVLGRPCQVIVGEEVGELVPVGTRFARGALDRETEREVLSEFPSPGQPGRLLEARALPLRARRGEGVGWLLLLRDVTVQRGAEAELREANEQLQTQLRRIEALTYELHEQAVRDPLTGLTNRRFLEECLAREVARARREEGVVAIVVMDVDGFKTINDTYLHSVGDTVLQRLGRLLRERTRREEEASRYGGDEFVVVLPGASGEQARRRAEAWRSEFAALGLPFSEACVHATLSMGVASYPDHGEAAEELLRAADRALYVSKGRGRNKVTLAEAELTHRS